MSSDKGTTFIIALQRCLSLAPSKIYSLIKEQNALPLSLTDANEIITRSGTDLELLTEKDWNYASDLYNKTVDEGIFIITFKDHDYPTFLRETKAPPPVLYLKGNKNILNLLPGVAIVGARKATEKGQEIARRISAYLAEQDWVVISGLALGIDAAAHLGALQAHGKTIAILAHGLHKASPKKNSQLAEQIIETGGAWMSEHPAGIEPRKEYFVPRNRIQVGLSAGSIIVESMIKSGSTTQAKFCREQHRELFAILPHNEENSLNLLCEGTKMLVSEINAKPIRTKNDYPLILDLLNTKKKELLALKDNQKSLFD